MSELLKVLSYEKGLDYFKCTDIQGQLRRVDLLVSGCLPEGTAPENLINKTVSIEYTHAFIELAEGVSILS